MSQKLQSPPPLPQTGFKTLEEAEKWARAITQYLDLLRAKIEKTLP